MEREWAMIHPDLIFLRAAFRVAWRAREAGNHPFGAVLVDKHGAILLEAENTVVTDRDVTAHAELNLMRAASAAYSHDELAQCSLYASTEPCPMCAGAIFWANVRRVVFGLTEAGLYEFIGEGSDEVLSLPCRALFARGLKPIEVVGPMLEDEARAVHAGFWS